MKLSKILNIDNLQGYNISNPTKQFKKLFPKKYIISFDIMGTHHVINVNKIPPQICMFPLLGYIFTYDKSLPKFLKNKRVDYTNIGSTFAICLDNYFIGMNEKDGKDVNLVIACGSKDKEVPPAFTEELIIRCNSKVLELGMNERNERNERIKTNGGRKTKSKKNEIKA